MILDQIEPIPTTGRFYRITYGDTLFGVAGRAFDVDSGPARYEAARIINDSAYNARFCGPPTDLFPDGQISFLPRFASDPSLQAGSSPAPSGHAFAVLWIPAYSGDEPTLRSRRTIAPGICQPSTMRIASKEPSPSSVLVARAGKGDTAQVVRVAHGTVGVLYRLATARDRMGYDSESGGGNSDV